MATMLRSPTSDILGQAKVFGTSLGNLVFDKTELFEMDGEKHTVADAVAEFSGKGILALPVFKMESDPVGVTSAVIQKVYYGYISTFDVMAALVEELEQTKDIEQCVKKLYSKSCMVLCKTGESKKIAAMEPTTPLRSVFDLLANPSRHLHRILVRQRKVSAEKGMVLRMLEQEDVIRFLLSNADLLGQFVHRPISDLEMLKERKVVSITDKQTALDGIKIMIKEDVNAIAVVDSKHGCVLTTFSSSDVRALIPETAKNLNLPVCEYIKSIHYDVLSPPVVCVPGTPLYTVMASAQMQGVFRIWVVDVNNVPVNCITHTDILQQFLIRADRYHSGQ